MALLRGKFLLGLRTRIQLRHALTDENGEYGYSYLKAWSIVSALDDDTVWSMSQKVDSSFTAKLNKSKAIGDGTIIGWIIDFFNSPLGKVLIDLLLKLLLGGLLSTSVEPTEGEFAASSGSVHSIKSIEQKGILDYVRLLRSLREAIQARNLAAIAQLIRDLGLAVGFAEEAGPLADALLAVANGEWAVVADAVGRFLVLVAAHFLNGFSVMANGQDVTGEILATIKVLK